MGKGKSRWVPQHPHWYEDLPEPGPREAGAPRLVDGDLNAIDENYLEMSRASSLLRGGGVLFGFFGVVGLLWCVYMLSYFFPLKTSLILPLVICMAGLLALLSLLALIFKIDLTIPRDIPVRLNRSKRKVYVYEHSLGMNPFVKWPINIKVFDWGALHAELHRQAGFNGRVYMQRFSLWIVSCKPGTNEVLDRFELKGNHPTTAELYSTWDYCRHYMENGAQDLPTYRPRRQELSFRRSFFTYIRFLDPTEEGREVRARMTYSDWLFNMPLTALMFWLFVPLGVGHYIAMRFAPDAEWPMELDEESRTAQCARVQGE